jgi:hypothetical protein
MRLFSSFALACAFSTLPASALAQSGSRQLFDEPANAGSQLGMNPAELTSYGREWVYVNFFRACTPWIPQRVIGGEWDTGEPIAQRPDGYPSSLTPNQAAATVIAQGMRNHYPAGPWVCRYDGDGDLEFRWDATVVTTQPGRYVLSVQPSQGILLRIIRTNPANPVRNIRLTEAHLENHSGTFHPRFLSLWHFCKVMRFLDWQKTNSTYLANWSERPRADYFTQTGRDGIAYEHLIELCNTMRADPWICVPHLATDDFVRQFATMLRANLRPDLKVYVEYSNECWNGSFVQATYCREQGLRLNLSTDPYEAQLRFYSQRSVEIFNIFGQVFGGNSRLVRVLGLQNVNAWMGTTVMDWRNAYQSADAVGVNFYFGHPLGDPARQAQVQAMPVELILAELALDIANASQATQTHLANARQRGLATIAFEGGQHLVGTGSAQHNWRLTEKFTAANRHPLMRDVYLLFLGEWRRIGGGMHVLYNTLSAYGDFGSWGALEYSDQPPATGPKYVGLLQHFLSYR